MTVSALSRRGRRVPGEPRHSLKRRLVISGVIDPIDTGVKHMSGAYEYITADRGALPPTPECAVLYSRYDLEPWTHTDAQADRHTDTQTHRRTDTRRHTDT